MSGTRAPFARAISFAASICANGAADLVRPQTQRTITGLHSGANTIADAMTDNALAAPPTADTSATWPYLR